MTQDFMFWQGLLEPVPICCWDGSLKMSDSLDKALRKVSEGSEKWVC